MEYKQENVSLVDSLNLTLTANELSADEWSLFSSQMGSTLILNSTKSLSPDDVKRATSTMKQIIQSRDEIPSDALAKSECIDQLPSNVIGHIGSYLNAKEYGRFEQCNRTLFVSCNSPNKLQFIRILMPKTNEQTKSFNFRKYASVRTLECWNNDIRKFNIVSSMDSVTHLCFNAYGPDGAFTSSELIEFVSKFPSTESLNLCHMKISAVNHDQNMLNMLPPNIKELRLCDHGFMAEIVKLYAGQIEKLYTERDIAYLKVQENNLKFPKLVCFSIWGASVNEVALGNLLSNAPKLSEFRNLWLDAKDLRMLSKHNAVKTIGTEIHWSVFESFCEKFESNLAQRQITSIQRMEMRVDVYSEYESKASILKVIGRGFKKVESALQSRDIHLFIDVEENPPIDVEEITGEITQDDIAEITKNYISNIHVSYFGESVD